MLQENLANLLSSWRQYNRGILCKILVSSDFLSENSHCRFGLHIQKCRQLQHHQENQGNLKLLGLNINKMVRDISSRSWIFKNEWIGYKNVKVANLVSIFQILWSFSEKKSIFLSRQILLCKLSSLVTPF